VPRTISIYGTKPAPAPAREEAVAEVVKAIPKKAARRMIADSLPPPASERIDAFVAPSENAPKTKKRLHGISDKQYEKAALQVGSMQVRNNWRGFHGIHAVALYERIHIDVYDQAPRELAISKNRKFAVLAADRLLNETFRGDVQTYLEYSNWVWARERGREEWRKANRKFTGSRVTWRRFFSRDHDCSDWYFTQRSALLCQNQSMLHKR